MLVFSLRLMQTQVVEGEAIEQQNEQGWTDTQRVRAARGEIFDRNGRPLVVNSIGRDVTINMAYMDERSSDALNRLLKRLIDIMLESGEGWIDNLPISDASPLVFKDGDSQKAAIEALKKEFGVETYATAEDVTFYMKQRYKLEDYNSDDFRRIAGVRYEMEQRGFSMSVPYTFATDVKIDTVTRIREHSFEMAGVDVEETAARQYVSGNIAPHLIGTVGPIFREQWDKMERTTDPLDGSVTATVGGLTYSMNDTIGKTGAELAFESYLKGTDGERLIEVSNNNDVLAVEQVQPMTPGNSVVLTLDSNLQRVAQDALEEMILLMQKDLVRYPPGKGHEASAGALVAINVQTGELLAAATYPSYDLDTYDYEALIATPDQPLINRPILGLYTPGSIFKPTVALGGLNEGIVDTSTRVLCTGLYTRFPDFPATCLSAHGMVNVYTALKYSCNTFFYETGWNLGIDGINKYAKLLGFGQATGIEIPEEIGRVSSPETKARIHPASPKWVDGDVIQTSIGQLDTMATPLQLANYAATLASDGDRKRVSILKAVKSYSLGETIYSHEPETVERIDSPEAFAAIREGMVQASRTGTAAAIFGEGIYEMTVASKTGTPETAKDPNSTFICFAPAGPGEIPKIAIAVVIEKGWHGYTGAPVAKKVLDAYFSQQSGETTVATGGFGELLP